MTLQPGRLQLNARSFDCKTPHPPCGHFLPMSGEKGSSEFIHRLLRRLPSMSEEKENPKFPHLSLSHFLSRHEKKGIFSRFLCGTLLLVQIPAYALNPVPGWYGGIFLGVSATPNSEFTFSPPVTFVGPNATISASSGSLSHSVLGNVGGEIGYRFCDRYRIEGEVMYNNNHFKQLTLNHFQLSSTYYPVPIYPSSVAFTSVENTNDAHIQGDTNTGAFMMNFFYDLFTTGHDGYSTVVPFVGAGIGYSYVQNNLQFYRAALDSSIVNPTLSREVFTAVQTRTTYAGQVIAGLHYFMDDFAWFSLDVRYFRTGSSNPTTKYTYITPDAVYTKNSSTNLFGNNTQLISANISFNGAFDFG